MVKKRDSELTYSERSIPWSYLAWYLCVLLHCCAKTLQQVPCPGLFAIFDQLWVHGKRIADSWNDKERNKHMWQLPRWGFCKYPRDPFLQYSIIRHKLPTTWQAPMKLITWGLRNSDISFTSLISELFTMENLYVSMLWEKTKEKTVLFKLLKRIWIVLFVYHFNGHRASSVFSSIDCRKASTTWTNINSVIISFCLWPGKQLTYRRHQRFYVVWI